MASNMNLYRYVIACLATTSAFHLKFNPAAEE